MDSSTSIFKVDVDQLKRYIKELFKKISDKITFLEIRKLLKDEGIYFENVLDKLEKVEIMN